MRDIKFRLFVGKTEMIYFDLFDMDGEYIVPHDYYMDSKDYIMQYIGLQDINKKDIYEGDLLKGKDGKINVVVWSNKLSGYILGTWLKKGKKIDLDIETLAEKIVECTYFICDEDEIIGNILENPKLLEIK